jgi:hypothetical protein
MCKDSKGEAILIFFIFIGFLIYNSMYFYWFGGLCFGPRYLTPTMPFLAIPLLYVFKKINLSFIIPFLIISIFINLLGLQTLAPLYDPFSPLIFKKQLEITNSFQIMQNPFSEHFLPLFLKNGPRSRIFEGILNGELEIDIRHWSPQFGEEDQYLKNYRIKLFSSPHITVMLKVPFLCLVPLTMILFLVWSRNIFQNEQIKRFLNRKSIVMIVIILLLIFFFAFFEITLPQ